jgi:hypothetical protein
MQKISLKSICDKLSSASDKVLWIYFFTLKDILGLLGHTTLRINQTLFDIDRIFLKFIVF